MGELTAKRFLAEVYSPKGEYALMINLSEGCGVN